MVEELGSGHEKNIDWWVSGIAGRNTYADSFFQQCCYAVFIRNLLKEVDDIEEIIVDSYPLFNVIKQIVYKENKQVRVICKNGFFQFAVSVTKRIVQYAHFFIKHAYRYLICSFILPDSKRRLPENATLVDIFILDQSFSGGTFNDRYYADFGGHLTPDEKKNFVYIPTLVVRLKNIFGVIRALRSADQRILLQEDILRVSDYVYAIAHPFRAIRFFPKKTMMDGIDVTCLVRKTWFDHLFLGNSSEALMKYCFTRRLKERGQTLRLIIEWFENQDIDKGAIAGFRRFYPETPIIGYQGFDIQKYYLCAYPTNSEHLNSVLPHVIAVCGKALIEERKQFCTTINVITGPAFRYMKAWDRRQGRNPGQQFTILILFPITINNAVNILKETVRLSEILNQDNVRFFLKPHPVTRLELILKHARLSLPSQIRVVEGDLSEYILEADVVVGNTSSSFLEAVAMGIPVIIVGDRSGITYNPIPEAVSQDIWALCYTAEEMVEAIRRFISYSHEDRRHLEDIGRDIRKSYFEPVTRESVRSFLRLPTQ
jgi:hypothetical protein